MYIRRSTEIEMAQDMTFALEERKVYDDVIAKASESDTYPQMFMKYSEEDQNTMRSPRPISTISLIITGLFG